MQFTNKANLPFALAVWCAHDKYNFKPAARSISATSLLQPTRMIVLSRLNQEKTTVDLVDLFYARRGTAIHDSIEKALYDTESRNVILKQLGWSDEDINKIVINPKNYELVQFISNNKIPLFIEQRFSKKIADWEVSGQFDFVFNGELHDFKTTSVITYKKESKKQDYILQGSIYKWIAPHIVKSDTISINYIFNDWNKNKVDTEEGYPEYPILEVKYPLLSKEETEKFIANKLNEIVKYEANPETLPECSDEELWKAPTVYKYFGENAVRCSKKFESYDDAMNFLNLKGKGRIEVVESSPKRCSYCPVFDFCEQRKQYFD